MDREQCGKERKAQLPDETKDEIAIRLRSSGLSFREIAGEMGIDVAMAHRRVKRALIRQRCEREDRMQDVRDVELEKLRRIEKAILPEAFDGDQDAARLALRIMEMRRRLLRKQPLEDVQDDPWAELMDDNDLNGAEQDDPFLDDASLDDPQRSERQDADSDAVNKARQARADEMIRAQAMKYYSAHGLSPEDVAVRAEAEVAQLVRARGVATNEGRSTEASTHRSTCQREAAHEEAQPAVTERP